MSTLIRLALAAAAVAFALSGPLSAAPDQRATDTVAFCPGPRGCHS